MRTVTVLGAGSWGSALAVHLGRVGHDVRLWARDAALVEQMSSRRANSVYLPDVMFPESVAVTHAIADALRDAELVVSAVPSHGCRGVMRTASRSLAPGAVIVSATKGLELKTLLRPSEIIDEVISPQFKPRITVLSGPTFAHEVAALNPTAIVISSADRSAAQCVQAGLAGPNFRLYTSDDPIGVEIGGSIKNVVAIGAGVLEGLGLGHNPMAALITRGLAEMTRLAVALGGQARTLAGLAGLGDLVLTCSGGLSRNRTVGVELARGRKLDEIVGSMKMVAEGIKTTTAAVELARRCSVEMPITEQMYQMLHHGLDPKEAIRRLMERTLKGE